MQVLLAKADKRAREEGKETVFFHAGAAISPERLENFKKRKIVPVVEEKGLSPGAGEFRFSSLVDGLVLERADLVYGRHAGEFCL